MMFTLELIQILKSSDRENIFIHHYEYFKEDLHVENKKYVQSFSLIKKIKIVLHV